MLLRQLFAAAILCVIFFRYRRDVVFVDMKRLNLESSVERASNFGNSQNLREKLFAGIDRFPLISITRKIMDFFKLIPVHMVR